MFPPINQSISVMVTLGIPADELVFVNLWYSVLRRQRGHLVNQYVCS